MWNEHISGTNKILQTAVEDDDIDECILVSNIIEATKFDHFIISKQLRDVLASECESTLRSSSSDFEEDDRKDDREDDKEEESISQSNLQATSQSNLNDYQWDSEKALRESGSEPYLCDPKTNKALGICFANIPTHSSLNARLVLTIMGQVTRLLILQIGQLLSAYCVKCLPMMKELFAKKYPHMFVKEFIDEK